MATLGSLLILGIFALFNLLLLLIRALIKLNIKNNLNRAHARTDELPARRHTS